MLTCNDLNPKSKLNAHFGPKSHIAATSIQGLKVKGHQNVILYFSKAFQCKCSFRTIDVFMSDCLSISVYDDIIMLSGFVAAID